jgi:methylthioribose-1-phosphate isomerase
LKIGGQPRRAIELAPDGKSVVVLDQTQLPFATTWRRIATGAEAADAIKRMVVRGAPLIGATAAYGLWLAMRAEASDAALDKAVELLAATRPTAVNLRWALERSREQLRRVQPLERPDVALAVANLIAEEDIVMNRAIGQHGLALLRDLAARKAGRDPVRVLTHCNAGWLATVDGGTALAPVYAAHDAGVPIHVWVDETRPRSQGARLTAFELSEHGVSYTLIADNAGGHLMQRGEVDLCLVGADRVTANGDVANKIGTYLKAVASRDTGVPFYVAAPSPTIDWTLADGLKEIAIEERDAREVTTIEGVGADGKPAVVSVGPWGAFARNPAFDVTPARLVTAIVTERGVAAASRDGLIKLFPERAADAAGARETKTPSANSAPASSAVTSDGAAPAVGSAS